MFHDSMHHDLRLQNQYIDINTLYGSIITTVFFLLQPNTLDTHRGGLASEITFVLQPLLFAQCRLVIIHTAA